MRLNRPHLPITSSSTTTIVSIPARMVISEYLRDCGYKVIEAANTDEALILLQHLERDVDAVLCGM